MIKIKTKVHFHEQEQARVLLSLRFIRSFEIWLFTYMPTTSNLKIVRLSSVTLMYNYVSITWIYLSSYLILKKVA